MATMAMSKEEIETFLSIPRMARMATISNGKRIVPVWYYYDGTNIIVTVPKETKKAKNVKNNPNVSIAIDIVEGKPEDISYLNDAKAVIIEGEAEMKMIQTVHLHERCMKDMLVRKRSTIQWFNIA